MSSLGAGSSTGINTVRKLTNPNLYITDNETKPGKPVGKFSGLRLHGLEEPLTEAQKNLLTLKEKYRLVVQ
jgi:hypothetical protein